MKKIVWMACGMALMCVPLSASANIRYDDPQEEEEAPLLDTAAEGMGYLIFPWGDFWNVRQMS